MVDNKAVIGVVGNGTMGTGITLTGAGLGLKMMLFNPLQKGSLYYSESRLGDDEKILHNIEQHNMFEDPEYLEQCDIVIEAVIEDKKTKQETLQMIFQYTGEDTVVGTNTSNIPIHSIAEAFTEKQQQRFMGIHFFNPVQYMKLVELIPHTEVKDKMLSKAQRIVKESFEKEYIVCWDTPGFIANRYGAFIGLSAIRFAEKYGYSVSKADALVGKVILRPKSGIFRLTDMIGLDIECEGDAYISGGDIPEWEKPYWEMPEILKNLYDRKQLGDKTGGGFYKKSEDGILIWDPKKAEYVPKPEDVILCLEETVHIEDPVERLKTILQRDDEESRFIKDVLDETFWFAEKCVGMICDKQEYVDNAMKYGYNWKMGPFELKNALGI